MYVATAFYRALPILPFLGHSVILFSSSGTTKLEALANHKKDLIDKVTLEIRLDDEGIVYNDLEELGEELPDHAPRFVLLSYPLTLVSPSSPFTPILPNHGRPPPIPSRTHANNPPVLRPPLSPLRPPLLPPRHLQRRSTHVIRRCEGITPRRGWRGSRY